MQRQGFKSTKKIITMPPSIGIDFGTTKTSVYYNRESSPTPTSVQLGLEKAFIPTSICLTKEGTWLFGEDADDALVTEGAGNYCRAFKLKLGSQDPLLFEKAANGEFITYSAEDLTYRFLRFIREKCKREVEAFIGKEITHAVITYPVSFSPAQKEDLRTAAEKAGFSSISLIPEPCAAGYAFCALCPEEAFIGTALVVDWGGGTLDLALISRKGSDISLHPRYRCGNAAVGGEVFDDVLWQSVSSRLAAQGCQPETCAPTIRAAQLTAVRRMKEALSTRPRRTLHLIGEQGVYPGLEYSREEFETLIAPYVNSSIGQIKAFLAMIQESFLMPEKIILVGGTSCIPFIKRAIEEQLGITCISWHHAREAVAMGAAMLATEGGADSLVRTGTDVEKTIPDVVQPRSKTAPSAEEQQGIMRAIRESDARALKQMLTEDVDLDFTLGNTSESPLILAAKTDDEEILRLLIFAGATRGATEALQHGLENNNQTMVELLIPLAQPDAIDIGALIDKIKIEQLQLLLNNGYNAHINEALLVAIRRNLPDEFIAPLVKAGADIDCGCLHEAAKRGRHKTVLQLLSLGANPNKKDTKGKFPFEYALSTTASDTRHLLYNRLNKINSNEYQQRVQQEKKLQQHEDTGDFFTALLYIAIIVVALGILVICSNQ